MNSKELNAKAAILVHLNSGDVFLEKNADVRLPMASLTKIMTALIVLGKIQDGVIDLKDEVVINSKAASALGSKIHLKKGSSILINDLLKGLLIASGNDAAIALAGLASSNVEEFVKEMNLKAVELGLKNTHFSNPHGLHSKQHFSTAREIYLLSKSLLEWEETLQISSLRRANILIGQESRTIKNTNPLIGLYQGADGLKTGYTPWAGYCLAATAQRNNERVLAIVLGEPTRNNRDTDVTKMLDYAFLLLDKK